ncbi:magnesium transporter CorA [bacterium]|nr:magnesium transporter CorA [bacterium]
MPNVVTIPIAKGTWIDVADPTSEMLEELTQKYGLHPLFVKNWQDPTHLPKIEELEDSTFIIARAFDEKSDYTATTVQELTRKVAIYISPTTILTLHRVEMPFIQTLRLQWDSALGKKRTHAHLVNSLFTKIIASYNVLIQRTNDQLEILEEAVFRKKRDVNRLEKVYELKRVSSIAERVVRITEEIIPSPAGKDVDAPYVRDLQDQIRRVLFSFDDLDIRTDHLLQLDLAIQSQKSNETMRVLTLFSAFFLPLTFIVGIYGMNFNHMPELSWKWGYPATLLIMVGISLGIWLWFRKKGWLGD